MGRQTHSKTSSHIAHDNVFEGNIVKLLHSNKNALIVKINTSEKWDNQFHHDLKVFDITSDKHNNIYLVGCTISNNGDSDIFVAKMIKGNIQHIKYIPGIKSDVGIDIQIDNHGDIYICGYFTDSITFDSIYLSCDDEYKHMFVAKINGKTWEWIWAINTDGHDSIAHHILIHNNNVYVIGSYSKEIIFNIIPVKKYISH